MKVKQRLRLAVFIAVCIMINYGGKFLANQFDLPVWFDAFGTALTAYGLGPVCGAIVGLTANIICGLSFGASYIYALTSIAIGIIVGIYAKKGKFETVFGTMTISVLVTLASLVISVPLNFIFFEGMTNNLWGDGVIGFLKEQGAPIGLCGIVGQFYVEFLDKVITLLLLYLVIRIRKAFINRRAERHEHNDHNEHNEHNEHKDHDDHKGHDDHNGQNDHKHKNETAEKAGATLALILVCGLSAVFGSSGDAFAAGDADDLSGYVRTVYDSSNGLPCGEANDIVQTNDGILWIGTYAGLYRYNGSEFRWMNEYDSVRNANCLYVDEEGRLWIGTNDSGVSICINENIASVLDTNTGLPSDSVKCITRCADGNYYIGTTDSLAVISLTEGLKVLNVINQVNFAESLAADDKGNVAAVNAEGKLFLLGAGEILATLENPVAEEIYTCVVFGDDGRLYAGTSGSNIFVYELDGSELKKTDMIRCGNLTHIQSINFTEDGRGYICADTGIGFIDKDRKYNHINSEEFNNSIDNMTMDYQGNLWFTSSRLGLLRLSESVFTDVYRTCRISGKVVNSVQEWNGLMYFGTDTGLDIADLGTSSQIYSDLSIMLNGTRIRCIRRDSRNNLWRCSYGKGLIKALPDGTTVTYDSSSGSFGNRARVVMELSDGTVVAAGDTGMSYITEEGIQKTLSYGNGFSNAVILSLLELNDGAVLAGTDGDGIVVIRNGEPVRNLTRYDGLSSGVILRMIKCTDGLHTLIVTSNGICCMDEDFRIRSLTNFPYFNNFDIWPEEGGKLFVLSSAGIYVMNEKDVISDTPDMSYELLDAKNGMNASLTANSWNYCDEKGNLFVSTDTGVYRIDTSAYTQHKRSYRMLVTSVKMDGELYPVVRGEEIDIEREVNKLEIFPEVINYTIDDPYVSYYLDGFDPAPTVIYQSELSSVTYTNLPTGSYTFYLRVMDSDKTTILEESAYKFVKEKAIYDNPWFIIYMVVVGVIAVAWFTWFLARTQIQRTMAAQQRQLELAQQQVQMGNETILAIAKTVDAKDENTSQHSQRVSEYSVMIARELGFSEKECENLRRAALLHDIGKIGIPDRILNKPARLTDEEYAIMKTHVVRGAAILKDFTLIENVVDGALYHHERYDGTGYANGLKGEEIPIYGRIIGVADAFDAMTANRVYRKKLDFDYVINELERCKGSQFDPHIADIMLKLVRDGKIDIERMYGKGAKDDRGE